jgi:hypothetical protein
MINCLFKVYKHLGVKCIHGALIPSIIVHSGMHEIVLASKLEWFMEYKIILPFGSYSK